MYVVEYKWIEMKGENCEERDRSMHSSRQMR